MKRILLVTQIFLFTVMFISCRQDDPVPEKETEYSPYYKYQAGEEFPIGKFTTNTHNYQAFGMPLPHMKLLQRVDFGLGNSLFRTTFSQASGLGPRFNARSCANCHFKDGRGRPLTNSTDVEGEVSRGFLMRLTISDAYGDQLQDKGLGGIGGEAKVRVTYEIITKKYPDGTSYELRKPHYEFYDEKFGSLSGALISPRVATQTIGLAFIDALTEEQILKNADENDADDDGISGKANYVWNVRKQKNTIGKFGWKSNAPTVEQQIAGALSGDMGMTTTIFPKQNCPSPQQDCNDFLAEHDTIKNVEFSDEQLQQVTFYQAALSVPERRNVKDKDVLKGKGLFHEMQCIKCHAIGFKVQKSEMIPQIEGTVFNPYSDFLVHDMGEDLADNRTDNLADGNEWRTQPLWGISMIPVVNKHTFLLHDGRARSIEEAILWHGGEAQKVKEKFMNLSKKEREQVIKFVNSL